jgi:glycosyltransferase involved in cell wall biosynthesis
MKIAQVAPLFERVPPELYGGTEGVVSYLTEALIDLGHGLTLFASGDSITRARLIPGSESALRLRGNAVKDSIALHVAMLGQLLKNVEEYDLIHFHIDYLHLPFLQQLPVSFLTTRFVHNCLHVRLHRGPPAFMHGEEPRPGMLK